MTSYFHFRRNNRQPGDIIVPGMRSILDLYLQSSNTNPWRLICELAMEERRLHLAPNAVSRIDSNFVFFSENDALTQVYKMSGCKYLLEVEMTNPDEPTFKGDFDLISKLFIMEGAQFLPKIRLLADPYWQGIVTGTPELLTASPLRVIRTVRSFA